MKQWSRKYSACQVCGKTEAKHKSYGFCINCWFKERYKNPLWKKYWKELQRKWQINNPEKFKFQQEKSQFKHFLKKYPKEVESIINSFKRGMK